MTAVSRASSTRVSAAAPWNSRGKRARRPAADGAPTPSAATSGRLSALADPRARLADGPVSPRGARPASLLLGSPAHRWRRPRALGPPPRRRSQPVCDKRPERPRALVGCAHTTPRADRPHRSLGLDRAARLRAGVRRAAACGMRARRSPPHTKPQDRDAAPGVDRPSFEEEQRRPPHTRTSPRIARHARLPRPSASSSD